MKKTFYILKTSYFRKGYYTCEIYNNKTKVLKAFNIAREETNKYIGEKDSLITLTVLQFESTKEDFNLIEKHKKNELVINPEILRNENYYIINVIRNCFFIE